MWLSCLVPFGRELLALKTMKSTGCCICRPKSLKRRPAVQANLVMPDPFTAQPKDTIFSFFDHTFNISLLERLVSHDVVHISQLD